MTRHSNAWSGQVGFLFSAVSSAIGLANIWKFPYMVGQYGGGAFLLLYLLFLLILGYPLLLCEIAVGYESRAGVGRAYYILSKGSSFWKNWPKIIVFTGFIVGVYYACVAGWFVGYAFITLFGGLSKLETADQASALFQSFTTDPYLVTVCASAFLLCCLAIVSQGVKEGIEKASRWLVPLLLSILIMMGLWVYTKLQTQISTHPLLFCDFQKITPKAVLEAMGHAFFTLSLGQGTMVAYGSYLPLSGKTSIVKMAAWVAISDTIVSLLSAFSILGFCQIAGMAITTGPGLVFETLPLLFNQFPLGYLFANLFFFLLLIATITSEISVIEPVILYLEQSFKLKRTKAIRTYCLAAFLLLLPLAYESTAPTLFGTSLLSLFDSISTSILIPLGGLITALFIPSVIGRASLQKMIFSEKSSVLKKYTTSFKEKAALRWRQFLSWGCVTLMPVSILVVFFQALYSFFSVR